VARLGIAGGNATRDARVPAGDWVYVQRHGDEDYVLPRWIRHEVNMQRLAEAGCDRVLGLGSVGGLREELGPGVFVCPDDFIALAGPSPTVHEGIEAHAVHGFDGPWRERVVEAWRERAEVPIVDGGIYRQTLGPRLETPAEVRMLAEHGDVVGMTIGSECAAASELGMAYAAICVVDNHANGIGGRVLTMAEFEDGRARNRETLSAALDAVLPALA
jgi:5'-methylthioadenosine phosphorylase